MTRPSPRNLLLHAALVLGGSLTIWGCGSIVLPPLTAPFPPRDEIAVESYKFRVAITDFTDQTGQAGDLVNTIPDILTTALFKLGRLDLYERVPLRGLSPQEASARVQELMEKRVIDGVITGAVTRFTGTQKTLVIELRLLSRNKAVMYASDHALTFQGRRAMEVDRNDIATVAKVVSSAIPTVADLEVTNKITNRTMLDGGTDAGVVAGMTGYVQARRRTINDPKTGGAAKTTYAIVAEIVIEQVDQHSSIGRILSGEDIQAGDTVHFK
jgi:hypothetical protein